jgi:hypothetical protein
MKVAVFCEAESDFRTATGLVDRVLREEGPTWVAEVVDAAPNAVREWIGESPDRSFFDVHRLAAYAKEHGVRVPQGHFAGEPGAADALMARTIFVLARRWAKDDGVHAVLVIRDMDDQGDERRKGLGQARTEAARWASFVIVLGCADPMREAWVLAGFEPESDEERERLIAVRKELGFHPAETAHALDAKDERAKRSAKRVLRALVGGDGEREARCWTEAPLDRLHARGERSGLKDFLDQVKERLVPRVARAEG